MVTPFLRLSVRASRKDVNSKKGASGRFDLVVDEVPDATEEEAPYALIAPGAAGRFCAHQAAAFRT